MMNNPHKVVAQQCPTGSRTLVANPTPYSLCHRVTQRRSVMLDKSDRLLADDVEDWCIMAAEPD